MFDIFTNFFRRKRKPFQIIDKRENALPIESVRIIGAKDPIHEILIGAAMQPDKAVIGEFKNGELTIKD